MDTHLLSQQLQEAGRAMTVAVEAAQRALQRFGSASLSMPDKNVHKLNAPEILPPVDCPLVVLFNGRLIRAERTGFIQDKSRDMEYRLENGAIVKGKLPWTYP